MTSDELFLRTLQDLEKRCDGAEDPEVVEYDTLPVAALLRKLLLDKNSLVAQVNRSRKLKILYPINRYDLPVGVTFSIQDGLDPDTAQEPVPQYVTRDRFLETVIGRSEGTAFTVKNIINYCAHVQGAVHSGFPHGEVEKKLETLAASVSIQGSNVVTRSLRAIGRVTEKGLRQLADTVRVEHDLGKRNTLAGEDQELVQKEKSTKQGQTGMARADEARVDPLMMPVDPWAKRPFSISLVCSDSNKVEIERREYARVWMRQVQPPAGAAFFALDVDTALDKVPRETKYMKWFARKISEAEYWNDRVGVLRIGS